MKLQIKLPVIALLASAMFSNLQAQELRLSGGYNGSNVSEAGPEMWVGRAGYQFGADVQLGGRWFVQPGIHFQVRNLNYTLAGTDTNGNLTGANTEFKYTDRSLRVPIMAGLNLMDPAKDPAFNVYLLGGPTALFMLKADLDYDALDVQTSKSQWYIGFGGGASFSFLFVEGGYDVAMSDVFSGSGFQTNPKVNQFRVLAGLRFRLAQ
ncbi:MAG: PorT family protein [Flavobacteriales bacterium]|nr:PorT family protein [Flavobacteriales bacterium]